MNTHTEEFVQAFNTGDAGEVAALFEPDGALVVEPGVIATGQAQVREAARKLQSVGTMSARSRYHIEAGDLALGSDIWTISGTGLDGEPLEICGTCAYVQRRQSDGRWLLVVDHPTGASS